ncbi:MAG TPA: TetR/AcrR family transcriptional regulator [Anaerolineales bacterium]|nr:TetR/AcrR family transcriptional regulator [Anaerolineales bacterium]HMX19601.1 TetR/AcrR family transcriptional regulator [Anaerolineales bacterium]HMX74015.1 TetR/AcrR family transcriptional regulator [Anaerolineales bacterium]HMZ43147.1 TetR/AcrR family transcriptional regulator [Anaerolineales bacterium]HNA54780.1 TetR/AcrR family transcriptional regulator [Anaerolineales bacterium]
MTQTRREKLRDATREEILSTAWKQIAEAGASGLSLRGIAREMGMTAPGLYRYYKDRDALVTVLLMDAFGSFADALETGRDACAADDHAGRFREMGRAYFRWGSENPQKYALLFGSPIHGYVFAEELVPVAQKSFFVLVGVIGAAFAAGKINGEIPALKLPTSLKVQYDALKKMGIPFSGGVIQLALSAWAQMHGITSLYLQNYLSGMLQDGVGAFVDFEIEKMIKIFGME